MLHGQVTIIGPKQRVEIQSSLYGFNVAGVPSFEVSARLVEL